MNSLMMKSQAPNEIRSLFGIAFELYSVPTLNGFSYRIAINGYGVPSWQFHADPSPTLLIHQIYPSTLPCQIIYNITFWSGMRPHVQLKNM